MALKRTLQLCGFPFQCKLHSSISKQRINPVYTLRTFSALVTKSPLVVEANDELESKKKLTSADHAFISRTGLQFSRIETYLQAVTHRSYLHGKLPCNERLEYLGQNALRLYVTEFVHSKYPNIPYDTMRDTISALTCLNTLDRFGRALGVHMIMRWEPNDEKKTGESRLVAKTTMALIGALYHDRGSVAARRFIHAGILSKEIDVESLLKLTEPKRMLSALLKRKGLEPPKSRLISETGRLSTTPAYLVGVFSGTKKIGDGFGSSIKMAEHRAAKDALLKYFLHEIGQPLLPSEAESMPEESQLTFLGSPLGDTPPII